MPGTVRKMRLGWTVLLVGVAALSSAETLRMGTWNVTNYTGTGRGSAFQNAIYGTYQGRSFAPDVLFAQEIESPSAAQTFRGLLNTAAGSPGDWNVIFNTLTGTSGTNANNQAMFYRTSKVHSTAVTVVASPSSTAGARQTLRFDFQLAGNATAEIFSVYNLHLKAGSSAEDQNRRQAEATSVRNNANGLTGNRQIMAVGDFNWQTSSQAAWTTFTGSTSNNDGRFFDPINTPGSWNDNNNFRFVHTQDPSGAAGMDDRFDLMLMGGKLGDGVGTEYVGAFGTAYSTTTWNDPNHSYRVWGNDGTSFNDTLTITGNAMVGSSIAQSLVTSATVNGGHLPVFADFRYDVVPEPASMIALGAGLLALVRRRRSANSQ